MKRILPLLLVLTLGIILGSPLLAQEKPKRSRNPASDRAKVAVEPGKVFVYKKSGKSPQELEVYFPPDWTATKKLPGVILFHGGGWGGGTLDQFRYACRYFASRGLVAATANYQLASREGGGTRKRVCITDAQSAIRWMKEHAAELGIDPARIITGGGSAGGHVSMLATLNPALNDPADPPNFDTGVVAYLLFNPAFDPKDSNDAEVDVLRHLKPGLPPAIFFFGTNDQWKRGTDAARERLKTLGTSRDELWIAEGQGHGFFNSPPWQDVTLAEADRFLGRLGLVAGSPTLPPAKNGEALVKAP
jgi:acetyl esterase/lipase